MPRTIGWDPPRTPFTPSHVAPLGVTSNVLRSAVASGRVVRLARGVFIAAEAVAGDPVGLHLQRAMAVQLRRPTAIASHRTAALAWGLALDQPAMAVADRVSFIVPGRHNVRSLAGEGFVIAARDLPAEHRVAHPSGLLVTSMARTAVDVAALEPSLPAALVVLDAAVRQLLIDTVGERRVRTHYTRSASLQTAISPLREAAEHAVTQFTRHRLRGGPRPGRPTSGVSRWSPSVSARSCCSGCPWPQLQVRIRTASG